MKQTVSSACPNAVRLLRMFFALFLLVSLGRAAEEAKHTFNLASADASVSLKAFVEQSGQDIVYPAADVRGTMTNEVKGDFTPREALDKMLSGTALSATRAKSGMLSVRKETPEETKNVSRAARSSDRPTSPNDKADERTLVLDTFEVMGSKSLNMDKPRTPDDPQPYVVFDRLRLEQSGALNVNDFLKNRLTMNSTAPASTQTPFGFLGDSSNINLRGLGTNQTLILIDGRRTASFANSGTPGQPDLNGIPLSAIERIEVLPTTASGIYGGGATGGVINIILRRDYSGVQTRLSYENTFEADTAVRRADFAVGLTLEHGKTNLMLSGSYADQTSLANRDRDFVPRGRAAVVANNPAFYPAQSGILPLGATPNIRNSNGTNLVLKNGTALNSPITFVPTGYAGTAGDGGAALAANAGKYNLDLAPSAQLSSTAGAAGAGTALLTAPTVESIMATVRRDFTPRLQAFVEAAASNNVSRLTVNTSLQSPITLAATAPNNPFTTAVLVQVPDNSADQQTVVSIQSRRMAAGLIARLPADWGAEADYTWSRTRQYYFSPPAETTATRTAMANGSIDILRDLRVTPLNLDASSLNAFSLYTPVPYRTTSRDATLRVSGPAFNLPAGKPMLSALLEYRDEGVADGINAQPTLSVLNPSRSQSVASGYLEALVPVVSPVQQIPLVHQLELQLAARYDDYKTNGATSAVVAGSTTPIVRATNERHATSPTIALRFEPVRDLAFRASYGEGFLPPSVTQLIPGAASTVAGNQGTDPRRGNETVIATTRTGGNPNLRPEKSKSTSVGAVFKPQAVAGIRLSVDYTRIRKTDNITALSAQQIIDNEALLGDHLTRGANLPTDLPGWPGPITFVDRSSVNIARATLEAWDLALEYDRKTELGEFDFFAGGTRTLHYQTQLAPTTPVIENVGFGTSTVSTAPGRWKANGGLTFTRGAWTLGWNFNYFSPYWNYSTADSATTVADKIRSQGNGTGRIPGQIYHDVFVTYRWRGGATGVVGTWLRGTEFQVGVKNVFDREPPFDAGNTTFYYSYYGDPRLARYYLSVKKSF